MGNRHLFASALCSLMVFACGDSGSSGEDPIAKGEAIVKKRACASCHVADDGSLSGQTDPQPHTKAYPPNLTPDPDTGLGDWTNDQIIAAILDGVDDEGEDLCSVMPKFSEEGMTQQDAEDVVAYLRSLAPVKHEIPERVSCTD